ncbi:MAG: hypothetical protein KIS96_11345 [Bauldia sp.]|nr:hypothetical protein [Bauldia sp.]
MATMTKGERDDLLRLVKKREAVLKKAAEQRSAQLLADFEAQSATIYSFDDDAVWKTAFAQAQEALAAAQAEIEKRCRALGIPPEFAPGINMFWHGRGQNAVKERQAELRRAAKAKIESIERAALTKIEHMSLEAQTNILASGLDSDAAKQFLANMPDISTLMPEVSAADVQAIVDHKRSLRARNEMHLVE